MDGHGRSQQSDGNLRGADGASLYLLQAKVAGKVFCAQGDQCAKFPAGEIPKGGACRLATLPQAQAFRALMGSLVLPRGDASLERRAFALARTWATRLPWWQVAFSRHPARVRATLDAGLDALCA